MKAKPRIFQTALLLTVVFVLSLGKVNAQTKFIKANGITIAYESFGDSDNETVLLIQGTGAQLIDWPVDLCRILAEQGYQVIRFDNRDVGLSTRMDSLGLPDWEAIIPFIRKCKPAPLPYTFVDMAEDASGLLEALHIEKAHMVGVSMGGAIAQLLAINHPEKVLTLTSIMASSGNPDLPQADEKAQKVLTRPVPDTKNPDTLATYLINIYKALGSLDDESTLKEKALAAINRSWYPEGLTRQIAAVLIGDNCDRRQALRKIKVPTMVIHGDADPFVKLACGEEVAATIPNAKLRVIKGMGHDISNKFIKPVTGAILDNLKNVDEEANKVSYYAFRPKR